MSIRALTLLSGLLLSSGCSSTRAPTVAGAEVNPAAEAEILATIDRFFEAMARRDAAAYGAEVIGEGMTFTQIWKDGSWELRQRRQQELTDALAQGRGVPNETYWDPTVLIRGPIAVVWVPYRFALDGQETHRGIDVFDMILVDGRWKIANTIWTREPGPDLFPRSPEDVRPVSLR